MSKLRRIITENKINMSDYDIFIETGLYMGDTLNDMCVNNMFEDISQVYSIEIEKKLVDIYLENHKSLNQEKISIIHGDSSIEIPKIIENNQEKRIIFWLDAHFSGVGTGKSSEFGECPLIGELLFMKKLKKKPLIIIDDISFLQNETWENWKNSGNPILSNHNQIDWPEIETIIDDINKLNFDFQIVINNEISYLLAL